jgi:hypothetical protein
VRKRDNTCPAGTAPPDLTARQWQVVKLAAAGLTNDEIAERLVLSVRTVHSARTPPTANRPHPCEGLSVRGIVDPVGKAAVFGGPTLT